jgi:hypothetical protein
MDSLTLQPDHGLINEALAHIRVDATPVTGQALSRKRNWQPHEREFWAADLHSGVKRLINPTLAQAAALTGAGSTSSVWWAIRRESVREEIMRGQLPMVPPHGYREIRQLRLKARAGEVSDVELFDLVREVGIGRVLDIAVAVEAAQ